MLWSWDGFDYTARIDAKEISQGVKANSPQVREHLPVVRIAPLATETTKATVSAQIGGILSVCPLRFTGSQLKSTIDESLMGARTPCKSG